MAENKVVALNLGPVTSYGLAKSKGFPGTEEAWVEKMMATATDDDVDALDEKIDDLDTKVDTQVETINATIEQEVGAVDTKADGIAANLTTLSGVVAQKMDTTVAQASFVPVPSASGAQGDALRNNGDGTTAWAPIGLPTDEQTGTAINAWLTAHPEATTTVQDGAITRAKLITDLQEKTDLAQNATAPAFDATVAYTPGAHVTYGGKLYVLPSGHEANATWADTTKTEVNLGGEVSDLKSAFMQLTEDGTYRFSASEFYNRGLDSSGNFNSNTARVSSNVIMTAGQDLILSPKTGFRFYVCSFNSGGTITGTSSWITTEYTIVKGAYYKICIARASEISETANIAEFVNALIVKSYIYENAEMIKANIAETGNAVRALATGEAVCEFRWEFGKINASGADEDSTTWIRTSDFIPVDNRVMILSSDSSYLFYIDYYNTADYSGFSNYVQVPAGGSMFIDTAKKYFRMCMHKSDDSAITIATATAANPIVLYTSEAFETPLLVEHYGWFNSSGVVQPTTDNYKEKYTDPVLVEDIEKIIWKIHYATSHSGTIWVAYVVQFRDGSKTRYQPGNYGTNQDLYYVISVPSNAKYISFTYRTYSESYANDVYLIKNQKKESYTKQTVTEESGRNVFRSSNAFNPYRLQPFHDHLFIDNSGLGMDGIIPSESVHHIRLSKRLGFTVIEGNLLKTSDGKYIVMHGSSGNFGGEVKHIDGVTNISNVAVSSKTLEWIKTNVVYNSSMEKYQTPVSTLQEWLIECKRNHLIPLIQMLDVNCYDITNEIMGKDNYIAYNGDRTLTSTLIVDYKSMTTKAEILDHARSIGVPYMYTMSNPESFTDAELQEIVDALHSEGFMIGIAGCYLTESQWQRVEEMGFDFSASGWRTPDIVSGNVIDLTSEQAFSGFNITGGSVSGGVLTLSSGDTVGWTAENDIFLSNTSLHIVFSGTITVKMGNYINNVSITSDGSKDVWFSTYRMNGKSSFLITASENTDVSYLTFKASKC